MNSINSALMQKIQANLTDMNNAAVSQEKATNTMLGRAAVVGGRSLADVRANAPAVERIFGSGATIQGANEQYVKQSLTDYATEASQNMQELRKIDPKQFAAMQSGTIADRMTGFKDVDSMLMNSSQKSIDYVTEMHYKENYKHVQEENLKAFNGTLQSAVQLGDPEILQEAIQLPKDMDPEAHKGAVLANATRQQSLGNNVLADLLKQSDMEFSNKDYLAMDAGDAAYAKFKKKEQEEIELQQSEQRVSALSDIEQYSKSSNATPEGLWEMINTGVDKYGHNWTKEKAIGWIGNMLTKSSGDDKDSTDLKDFINMIPQTTASGSNGQQKLKENLQERVNSRILTPQDAENIYISAWARSAYPDARLDNELSAGFTRPLLGGEINPQFTNSLDKFNAYYASNPTKASSMISDKTDLQRVLNINSAVKSGATYDEAVQIWSDDKRVAATVAYRGSQEFRKACDDVLDKAASSNLDLPGIPDDYWDAAERTPGLISQVQDAMYSIAMRSGSIENLAEAGFAQLRESTEVVDGVWVNNGGKSINSRYGGKGTGDEIITHLRDTHFNTMFADYDPEKITMRYNNIQGTAVFYLKDEFGRDDVPDENSNFGKPYKMQDLANIYSEEVVQPRELKLLNDNIAKGMRPFELYKAIASNNPEYDGVDPVTKDEDIKKKFLKFNKEAADIKEPGRVFARELTALLKANTSTVATGAQEASGFIGRGSSQIMNTLMRAFNLKE